MQHWIPVLVLSFILPNIGLAGGATENAPPAEAKTAAHEVLVRAIREKQVLRFVYNGHVRVVEPHAYGVTTTGEVVLHAFQIDGDSASRPPPGWRTFNAALIEKLAASGERFSHPRPGYVQGEPALITVWAALEMTGQ